MTTRLIELLKLYPKSSMTSLAFYLGTSERHVRTLVSEIRENDLADGFVLVSGDLGYWLSQDSEEISEWLRRYLGQAFSQIRTAKTAKKFLSEQQTKGIQTELNF